MQIETNRLVLREFQRSDWSDVHKYACDPEVCAYMQWGPNTTRDTKEFIDRVISHQRSKPRQSYEFAATLIEGGQLIGAAGLTLVTRELAQGVIGYCYNKEYWRCGYGAEACAALIDFGFRNFKLHRIYATCDARNVGSAGVLSKNGMRQEGHFKEDLLAKGTWRDTLLFAVLRSEWESQAHA